MPNRRLLSDSVTRCHEGGEKTARSLGDNQEPPAGHKWVVFAASPPFVLFSLMLVRARCLLVSRVRAVRNARSFLLFALMSECWEWKRSWATGGPLSFRPSFPRLSRWHFASLLSGVEEDGCARTPPRAVPSRFAVLCRAAIRRGKYTGK